MKFHTSILLSCSLKRYELVVKLLLKRTEEDDKKKQPRTSRTLKRSALVLLERKAFLKDVSLVESKVKVTTRNF